MIKKIRKVMLMVISLGLFLNNGINNVSAGSNIISQDELISTYATEYSETYYEAARGLKDTALKNKLRTIITESHTRITSYDDCKDPELVKKTDADPNKSGNIILFWSGLSVSSAWDGGKTWNREHVWPKSNAWYVESGGGSDLHHIRPTDPTVNSTHNNSPYGIVTNGKYVNMAAINGGGTTTCKHGGGFFEPCDEKKGDTARIIFYLLTRYSQADSYSITKVAQSMDMLLEWNESDPVDDSEVRRNNAVADIQGNRNPFIDHSEFANMIWDDDYLGNGALEDEGSSTPLENYLKLSISSLTLEKGETYKINPQTNISNPTFTYSSSNKAVATVSSSGLITAVSEGNTIITVTCGTLSSSLNLIVTEEEVVPPINPGTQVSGSAKYTVNSTTNVTISNAPTNSSAKYSQTYTTKSQIINGNSATLTLSGYDGLTITGFTLSMKSNTSKGAGSLKVTCGNNEVYSISDSSFNSQSWYGNWSTSYVNIVRDNEVEDFKVGNGEKVVFTINASQNSLYIESYTINYEVTEVEEPKTLSLTQTSLTLEKGESYTLNPITNISNPIFTYSSSNTSVATIDSTGKITALKDGNSTITVYCEDLSATLSLIVTDTLKTIKDEIEKLETQAQLDFGYTYSKIGSSENINMKSNVTTSTNMNESSNYASSVGLDPKVFSVNAIKGKPGQNVGLYNDGTIRVYADRNSGIGNILSVSLLDSTNKINTISFTETKGATLTITDSEGKVINPVNNVYNINDYKFNIQNTQNNPSASKNVNAYISNININYGNESIDYNYFGNANIKFIGSIPNEYMDYIDSYGISFTVNDEPKDYNVTNYKLNGDMAIFALKLSNITDFKKQITATAYVYINGEKIQLQSKTYSVYDMLNVYINDENLNLSDDQIEILNAFKTYIDNN